MSESITAILSGLSAEQSARLMKAVQAITGAAQARFGVSPTLEECLATAQAKEAAFSEIGSFDLENALFQISKEADTVVKHVSASVPTADATQMVGRYADSGIVTAADIEDMPPYLRAYVSEGMSREQVSEIGAGTVRMAVSRALSLSKSVRTPGLPDVRNKQVKEIEDNRPLEEMTPVEKMNFARRSAAKS